MESLHILSLDKNKINCYRLQIKNFICNVYKIERLNFSLLETNSSKKLTLNELHSCNRT